MGYRNDARKARGITGMPPSCSYWRMILTFSRPQQRYSTMSLRLGNRGGGRQSLKSISLSTPPNELWGCMRRLTELIPPSGGHEEPSHAVRTDEVYQQGQGPHGQYVNSTKSYSRALSKESPASRLQRVFIFLSSSFLLLFPQTHPHTHQNYFHPLNSTAAHQFTPQHQSCL